MHTKRLGEIIKGIHRITDCEINIIDDNGYIIQSTNHNKVGDIDRSIEIKYGGGNSDIIKKSGYLYKRINLMQDKIIYITVNRTDKTGENCLNIIELFLSEKGEIDSKENFYKNVILNNAEDVEIQTMCKRYDIDRYAERQVVAVKIHRDISDEFESIISNLYPDEILVQTALDIYALVTESVCETGNIGKEIYNAISSELLYDVKIGIGSVAQNINQLNNSYEKALKAMELGEIFSMGKNIHSYDELIIPLIIKNIDKINLMRMIESTEGGFEELLNDRELLKTAWEFLKNNLSISETAREIYVHRNTLVYRLNKIKKITGLDLRCFEDAVNFKVKLFIYNYLNYEKEMKHQTIEENIV